MIDILTGQDDNSLPIAPSSPGVPTQAQLNSNQPMALSSLPQGSQTQGMIVQGQNPSSSQPRSSNSQQSVSQNAQQASASLPSGTLILSPERKSRLQSIIGEMEQNGESEEFIGNYVKQFAKINGTMSGSASGRSSEGALQSNPNLNQLQSQDEDVLTGRTNQDLNQSQPQHGVLYNLANRALNTNTDTGMNNYIPDPLGILQGAAKGAISTGTNLVGLVGSGINSLGGNVDWDLKNLQANNAPLTQTQGFSQGLGKFAEQAAEYMIPAGEVAKAVESAPLLARMVAQSLVGAGTGLAQSGSATGTLLGGVLGGAGEGLFSPETAKALGTVTSKMTGLATKAGQDAVTNAFKASQSGQGATNDLISAMRGKITLPDLANSIVDSVTDHSDLSKHIYESSMDMLRNNPVGKPRDYAKIASDTGDALDDALKNFNIDLSNPTRIPADVDASALSKAKAAIEDWGSNPSSDFSMQGIDNLKQIVKSYTDPATVGPKTSRIVNQAVDTIRNGMDSINPAYTAVMDNYHNDMELLRNLKSKVNLTPNTNPKEFVEQLQSMVNNLGGSSKFKQDLLGELNKFSKINITDALSGFALSSLIPQTLRHGWGPAQVIAGTVMHGLAAPEAVGALASSPRVVGESANLLGRLAASPMTGPAISNIQRGIQSGVTQASQPYAKGALLNRLRDKN